MKQNLQGSQEVQYLNRQQNQQQNEQQNGQQPRYQNHDDPISYYQIKISQFVEICKKILPLIQSSQKNQGQLWNRFYQDFNKLQLIQEDELKSMSICDALSLQSGQIALRYLKARFSLLFLKKIWRKYNCDKIGDYSAEEKLQQYAYPYFSDGKNYSTYIKYLSQNNERLLQSFSE